MENVTLLDTLRKPLLWLLVSRLGVFLVAYLGLTLLPLTGAESAGMWQGFPDNRWLDAWARWDSGWYRVLAERGYSGAVDMHRLSDTRFFPLYPLLLRWLRPLTGDVLLGGVLVSNVLFLVAGTLLYRLVLERYGEQVARNALILLCTYPFSFFFSAVYTESLFLACVVGAFLSAQRGYWVAAGLCSSLAAVTKVPGFLVMAALLLDARRSVRATLALGLGVVLPLIHLGASAYRFGDPLTFLRTHVVSWGGAGVAAGSLAARVSAPDTLAGQYPAQDVIQLIILAAALATCILAFFQVERSWAIWSLANLVVVLNAWHSTGRYVCVLFPLFVTWARVLTVRQVQVAAFLGCLGLSLGTVLFGHWSTLVR